MRETDYIRFTRDDVSLQLAPAAFDVATLEMGPLLTGARLAVHPRERPDGRAGAGADRHRRPTRLSAPYETYKIGEES